MMNRKLKNNKKALSMIMIIGIIISSITLIILLFYITSEIESYRYSESLIACNLFFSNIDGKPTYFTGKLDAISSKLTDEIAKQCPSKKVKVNENTINNAAKLISDCWDKTAKGEDIFGANVKKQKICLYCGEIFAENSITNFRGKLSKELEKTKYSNLYTTETGIENLNKYNLQLIPQNLETGQSTSVFYYLYRSDIPKEINVETWIRDEYLTTVSKLTGEAGSIFTLTNFYSSSNVLKTYGGIILTKKIENKNGDDFDKMKNSISLEDCTIIIPNKQFE